MAIEVKYIQQAIYDADIARLTADLIAMTAQRDRLRESGRRIIDDADKRTKEALAMRDSIARLTAERGAEKALTEEMYLSMRSAQEAQAQALDRARTAEAERDAERAGRERAERVAVWAAKNGNVRIHHYRNKHKLAYFDEELNETAKIEFNGHDPDLYRALVEACEGGRDGE